MPTLEEVLEELAELAEVDRIDPDDLLVNVEVDSLDLLEWVCALEDDYGLVVDEEALTELAQADGTTFRSIYEKIAATQVAV